MNVTSRNWRYPAALLLIILLAGYLLYSGYFAKPSVNLAAYQTLCEQYLQAPANKVSHDKMQLLIYKINYLFPGEPDALKTAAERDLKRCAQKLAARMKQSPQSSSN